MNPTLDLLMAHRSIRQFKTEPIPTEHLHAAIAAGQMASTSSAAQAYSVLRVTDPAKRERLAELCGGQEKVRIAPEFLVICGDSRRHRLAAQREGKVYAGGLEPFMVAVIDASLFAEKLAIAFEALGYGICYIGGVRNDLRAVDELLKVPHGVYPVFGMCVGKPDQEPALRPRLPLDTVLCEDAFPDDADVLGALAEYDRGYAAYLAERGSKPKGWTEAMAATFGGVTRDTAPYYEGKGLKNR